MSKRAALFAVCGRELSELRALLQTQGIESVFESTSSAEPDPSFYLGSGKISELSALDVDCFVCDDELSPRQVRNLEKIWQRPVLDRTGIVLDIFAERAQSSLGKLQVDLARARYELARVRGMWTHLERTGGGIGARGPGEQQLETDRRILRRRIRDLEEKIQKQALSCERNRAQREESRLGKIAVIGYTNSGKSTLVQCLSGSSIPAADQVFHTLDTRTRKAHIIEGQYLLSDTIGFINRLPHDLLDAFSATLEEARRADLLLHVQDVSAPDRQERIDTVKGVLCDLGAEHIPEILVYNKADLPHSAPTDGIAVSARTGEGLEQLAKKIDRHFARQMESVDLFIPYHAWRGLHEIYSVGGRILRQKNLPEGIALSALLPRKS